MQTGIAEDPQRTPLHYALAKESEDGLTISNIMPIVKCRDFFSDILYTQSFKLDKFYRYGLTWSYSEWLEDTRLNKDYMYLILGSEESVIDNLKSNIHLVHLLEAEMKMRPTIIHEYPTQQIVNPHEKWRLTDNDITNFICISFDTKWFKNSILMNFYTFILRLYAAQEVRGTCLLEWSTTIDVFKEILSYNLEGSDMGFLRTLFYKEGIYLEQLIYNWRAWLNEPYQPYQVSEEDAIGNPASMVHTHSCLISLFNGIKRSPECTVKPWVKAVKELVKEGEEEAEVLTGQDSDGDTFALSV